MIKKLSITFFFLLTTVLYLHNLTHDIYSGDIGDLVTAGYVWGIAHPSGYPLLVLLIGIFSHLIPLSIPVVTKAALISALSSLIALGLYCKFALRVTKNTFLALLSTSILAFSYLFWLHAEIPEVFGLNNFFIIVLLYFAIQFYEFKRPKDLYLLAFFTGLSMTHHQTIIFIFPSLAILVFFHFKTIFSSWKRLFALIGLVLLGFSVYLYAFIAAQHNPPINWDTPNTLQNLIRLFLRKDYGTAPSIASPIPLSVKLIHLGDYWHALVTVFSYQVLFVIVLGLGYLIKIKKGLFTALLVAFIISGPFYVFYAASFIGVPTAWGIVERFYTMSTVILAFCIPYGLTLIQVVLDKVFSKKIYALVIIGYFLIIPFFLIQYNFPKTNLSKTQIGNTYVDDIFASVPHHTVLFITGDTTIFNTWYNYYALHKRPDLDLVNPPGVGGNIFLDNAITRYHETHKDVPVKQLLNPTILDLSTERPVWANYDMPHPSGTVMIPYGLTYKLAKTDEIPDKEAYLVTVEKNLKKLHLVRRETLSIENQNLVTPEIPTFYSNALVHTGDFLLSQYQDPTTAEHYYRRALWVDDENPNAYSGLALSLFNAYNDCKGAVEQMNNAIYYYPVWKQYYAQLYLIQKKCSMGTKKTEADYKTHFMQDIQKDPEVKQSVTAQ